MYEFHIAKYIRDKFQLSASLFEYNGNVVLANFPEVRKLAQKINESRNNNFVTPGELNALGLIDEICHYIVRQYENKMNPNVIKRAYSELEEKIGKEIFNFFIKDFIRLFPPKEVYSGSISVEEYFSGNHEGRENKLIALEELIMLELENSNKAAGKFKELFDNEYLGDKRTYEEIFTILQQFFSKEPPIGEEKLDLLTFLKKPLIEFPQDLMQQLNFIRERWAIYLDDEFVNRILTGKDLFKEEYVLEGFGGGFSPTFVPQYKDGTKLGTASLGKSGFDFVEDSFSDYEETEQFTPDVHWMPNVVLLAKNTYVWLDQLSKKYGKSIKRLDEIPDEELDLIASRNFNSIWLIGVWERSSASKKIKHLMGNIDAVASAYSLYDYQIANDLGGEEAYRVLDAKCKERGIRLASDMVPNHTGIYSDWTINHPEYFIQREDLPYPNYTFNGEDLSEDPNIEIKIEDGYYSKSDAAVVFRWRNKNTGEVKYIYHGNDGTNMPWNDTAQLNMLKEEVREAVIQKIFDVARRFSIIRFDAAMTLAKKHFQRLWYPQPGTGGDIPTRSEFAMTRKDFDNFFPKEFWREVVDRINETMPETLLLAEAFWLMEGYFVRTLGMHRVYNSAFMHMMMNEENDKYRDLITNTLEFDPDILKRYVNFMSNPDEETAIKQFGMDDKYFGVCVLMSTLPGLPMFAHGQIEGYTEKYGMEYKRAYYDEYPNNWLVERHNREIFPLLGKRYLFSEVENFWFYDFYENGSINENVFAFTNSFDREKVLVLYNNKYERATGRINKSTPKINKGDKNKSLHTILITEALGIKPDPNFFYRVKELTSHQEYLFAGDEFINGIEFSLDGFKYKVFYGFEELYDSSGELRELKNRVQFSAVKSVKKELELVRLAPVHEKIENFFEEKFFDEVVRNFVVIKNSKLATSDVLNLLDSKMFALTKQIQESLGIKADPRNGYSLKLFIASMGLTNQIIEEEKFEKKLKYQNIPNSIVISENNKYHENSLILVLCKIVEILSDLYPSYEEKLELKSVIVKILNKLGRGERGVFYDSHLLRILSNVSSTLEEISDNETNSEFKQSLLKEIKSKLATLLDNEDVAEYINVNKHNSVVYYSKENFEELLDWLFTMSILKDVTRAIEGQQNNVLGDFFVYPEERERIVNKLKFRFLLVEEIKDLSANCGYQFVKLKDALMGKKFDPIE